MRYKVSALLAVFCLSTAIAMAVSRDNDSALGSDSGVDAAIVKPELHGRASHSEMDFDLSAIKRPIPKVSRKGGLFQSHSWYAPPPPAAAVASKSLPPLAPTAPTLPFTYIGRMIDGNVQVLFLSDNDHQYAVKVGDMLDNDYRLDKIGDNQAVLTYLPMKEQQTLTFSSAITNSPGATEQPDATPVTASIPATPAQSSPQILAASASMPLPAPAQLQQQLRRPAP